MPTPYDLADKDEQPVAMHTPPLNTGTVPQQPLRSRSRRWRARAYLPDRAARDEPWKRSCRRHKAAESRSIDRFYYFVTSGLLLELSTFHAQANQTYALANGLTIRNVAPRRVLPFALGRSICSRPN